MTFRECAFVDRAHPAFNKEEKEKLMAAAL
jgi:hypothetical protein